jgi:hypothetical protein
VFLLGAWTDLLSRIAKKQVGKDTLPIEVSDGSIENAVAITPNDAADLANSTIAIYVGTEGDLKVILTGGTTVTIPALAAGVWHPIRAVRIFATGTTATDILGAY